MLEKFVEGTWQAAARLTLEKPEQGIASPCWVEYEQAYALQHLDSRGAAALSTHLPVSFGPQRLPHWQPFLLDILPSGFGRELLTIHQNWPRPDGAHNDAAVLAHGAGNPGGNTRVAEAHRWLLGQLPTACQGWAQAEMNRHDADFIEYARLHGTLVAGTSTQGQAAKLWLTRHRNGLYYADILVPDQDAEAHFLLKLPRNPRDAVLLRHEFVWLALAKMAGLDVHEQPFMEGDLLFIPRFDRIPRQGGVHRRAVESAFSLMQVAQPGQGLRHEDIIEAWLAHADMSAFGHGLLEYLRRDILAYCLRVDDNHGRNTAFFLGPQGLRLSPLFDFAPMFLADDPPARATLWRQFDPGEHAQWPRLFETWLPSLLGPDFSTQLAQQLAAWRPQLEHTRQHFLSLPLDPRTAPLGRRFETALKVLDALP